jgi:hypothetical protein
MRRGNITRKGGDIMNRGNIILSIVAGIIVCITLAFAYPVYNVWSQGKKGEAVLERASQERQIITKRAKAELDAAKDTAAAIEIVGAAAQKYPEYRHQEFMSAFGDALTMEDSPIKIILVPTEAQMPILLTDNTIGD